MAKAIGCEQARNPQSKYSKTSDQFCFYNKTNEKYKKTWVISTRGEGGTTKKISLPSVAAAMYVTDLNIFCT